MFKRVLMIMLSYVIVRIIRNICHERNEYIMIYIPEITKFYFRTFCTFVHCSWVPLDILIRYYSCFSVVVDLLTQLLIRL